jgi:hypothetical protein
MSLVRVGWRIEKTEYLRREICRRFLSSPSVTSSTIPVAASALSNLSWNSRQNFCHSLLLVGFDACTDWNLQAFKTNAFGEDVRLSYEANSTHGYLYVDFGDLRWKVSLTHCTVSYATRGPHLELPYCRNNLYFQTGYTICNSVASMKLLIHICHWICLRKLDSTKCFLQCKSHLGIEWDFIYGRCIKNVHRMTIELNVKSTVDV